MINGRGIRVGNSGSDTWWNPGTPTASIGSNPFYWNCPTALITAVSATPTLPLRDRSYPSSLCTNLALGKAPVVTNCDFFWVPLVRNADPRLGRSEPQCAVFVMHKAAVAVTPTAATGVNSGDDTSTYNATPGATAGAPVPLIANSTCTATPTATSTAASGLAVGDLTLYGPVPLAALNAQWTDLSTTPTLSSGGTLQWEVLPQTNQAQPGYRSNPANYTAAANLFNSPAPYAQVLSGSKAVTFRVIMVSGDMLLQK
jgi:hypothetical protein